MNKAVIDSRYSAGFKVASVFLSAALLASTFTGLGGAMVSTKVEAASDYGLADNIEDGNILHCFNWKLSDIKAELPAIAEAGFTSVQTSPLQAHDSTGAWYWLYQPLGFSIGNELGSYDDLKSLCAEADKYGIKVVVDVVANHLAGWNDGRWASDLDSSMTKSEYFHNEGACSNWDNRYDVTHKNIGMPDLNSENTDVQNIVAGMITSMKSAGVDGIRWDAAKHIGLPSEGCQFWAKMSSLGMYNYGEILDNPAGSSGDDYNSSLMAEYGKYIGVTDATYSGTITGNLRDGNVTTSNGNWANRGVSSSHCVYWAESHDTYCNNGWTNGLSENLMDRAYAVLGARANSQALYFSRPFEKNHDSIMYGVKGSTHFTSKEVAAVNHFHNAMVGTKEYYTTGGGCDVVCRGGGAVIVAASGSNKSVTVPNGGGLVPAGTYTDEVSGSTWTVTSSTMTGQIGSSGIAVIYNSTPVTKRAVVSASPESSSFTDTVTVTMNVKNADSGTYQTSEGKSGTYTNGQTITLGSSASVGGSVTLTLSATGSDGVKATKTYTYTKADPSAKVSIYFDNSGYNWSTVYAYVYDESSGSVKQMAAWPGVQMTEKTSEGYYVLDVDSYKGTGQVIFSDNGSSSNRYPADMQPGLSIGSTSMKFSKGNTWEAYSPTPVVKDPTVTADKASGTSFTTETLSITLTLANATSGTYKVDNGPEKTFTGSATVAIGEGKIGDSTVTVETTATGSDGTKKSYTFTYNKKYTVKTTSSSAGSLSSYYSTNKAGVGKNKTITVDGDISDWDSSMIIAQGTANDDPRVYRPNSMYEVPLDLYTLYGAYDDSNLYLMWEMTNVQDVVAPNDDYPLSQGILYQTMNIPFFIAIDTKKSSDAIGNKGQTTAGGTIWGSGITFKNSFNRLIAVSTNGANGPFVYSGSSAGLNAKEVYTATTSGITFKYGLGILSQNVYGIDGAYGANNNRVVGDMCNASAAWVDFNTKGHKANSATMDFHYEMSIPLSTLGITKSDITTNGIGALLIMTSGKSGMDCLPYDLSMNDQADLDDSAGSQENNSFEKSDEDYITTSFAGIGKAYDGTVIVEPDDPVDPTTPLQVNFGTDRSAPQLTTTALTIKGIGIGGTAPYKYEFSIDNKVVKASNTTATYTWTPSTSGSHTMKCVITDSTGATATATKTFTAEGTNVVNPTDLTNTSSVSSTSVQAYQPVTITGSATGGTAPYKYWFSYKKSTETEYTVLGEQYGSATTATFYPAVAGTYNVIVRVKDAKNKVAKTSFTVKATSSTSTLKSASTINNTTITLGNPVRLTGKATGGKGSYTYAFYFKRSSNTMWKTLGTEFSSTSTAKVTPTSDGYYDFRILVKDSTGIAVTKTFKVTVKKANTALTNTSTVSATSVKSGTAVKLTGKATGGTAPYKYAFYYKRTENSSWKTIGTAYGTATSGSFTPTSSGTFDVKVSVKDNAGKIVTKSFTVKAT